MFFIVMAHPHEVVLPAGEEGTMCMVQTSIFHVPLRVFLFRLSSLYLRPLVARAGAELPARSPGAGLGPLEILALQ